MDRDRIDRLSRLVAAAGSRRDALRLIVAGAMAGSALGEGAAARKRERGRHRQRRPVRAQQEPPVCPTTCTQDCSTKPLHGGVNLTRCDFTERDLDGANLRGANLTRACFGHANLRFADLRATNVAGACFCGAALTGANFRGSNVTAEQLACANVACDTILPNGKPAVPCDRGERCCDGVCVAVATDPDNCGSCGNPCGVCQFCNFGTCEDLADGQFDCNRAPLVAADGGVCTAEPHTGICDGGVCNCGPGGDYDAVANICRCNQDSTINCDDDETGQCCEILETCLVNGQFQTEFVCFNCGSGGTTDLCCEYSCGGAGPDKFVCIPHATPGVTQCDDSFEGCAFNDGTFVAACADCGAS
jgi:hypothetical protein